MLRFVSLVALLAVCQGFGVAPRLTKPSTKLAAADKTPEENFAFDPSVLEEAANDIMPDTTTSKDSMPHMDINMPKMDVAKVESTLKDLGAKAQDFAKDERVQEISAKASDFAKDVFGKIFTTVGDKLKEIKAEKEEINTK